MDPFPRLQTGFFPVRRVPNRTGTASLRPCATSSPPSSRWHADGRRVAIATVVERRGSAPRDPGASLALNDLGEIAGSVTGGCVEPSVIREAQEVLDGGGARLREYGIADDTAFEVGLACGGTVGILIAPLDTSPRPGARARGGRNDRPAALTLVASGERIGAQRAARTSRRSGRPPGRGGRERARRRRGRGRVRARAETPPGDVRLRRDRPRRRACARREAARLPRHRLRRPRRLRHAGAVPGGRRARRRLARPVPPRRARRRRHRHLRAHARREVRRARADRRAGDARPSTSARWAAR